ncbi:glucokinase [Streptomyces sp. CNQ-509]|uniref:ROK family protein n=1 Tax=Streptomyces sp. CNQ-509 TaxID=444103 RepID=UPI00051E68F1|nr:ROK family protein [Streptomyces sp. CNQ-509]AIT42110.1 putative transcriptional regulator [Streptomyces sp. CNQ-509]AKH85878.1 glucokinase [Streptomyces sp. CNQ-509]
MTVVAALDIGGTKTAAALVGEDGRLLHRRTAPTPAAAGPAAVLDAAAAAVAELTAAGGPYAAVGVGSAGVIDAAAGTVLSATAALPGWAGTALRDELGRRLGVPVAVDNDVHAHALGETWRGAAAGRTHVLLVAAGTGIGGSLVLDGRPLRGARSAAGHLGHLPVPAAAGRPCTCGGTGHAEAVAAGPAMAAEYHRRAGEAAGGDPAGGRGLAVVAERAAAGDTAAVAVLAEGAAALGEAVGGLVNALDPELVLVTGGVSRCGPVWWRPLRAAITTTALPLLSDVPVVPGELGDDAALLGAARLAREAIA